MILILTTLSNFLGIHVFSRGFLRMTTWIPAAIVEEVAHVVPHPSYLAGDRPRPDTEKEDTHNNDNNNKDGMNGTTTHPMEIKDGAEREASPLGVTVNELSSPMITDDKISIPHGDAAEMASRHHDELLSRDITMTAAATSGVKRTRASSSSEEEQKQFAQDPGTGTNKTRAVPPALTNAPE